MRKISFQGRTILCDSGDNLRRVLMAAKLPLCTATARAIHCRGMGTCGTCAVSIQGAVSPLTRIEQWRLGFPPHTLADTRANNLRLACQCKVLGDLQIEKLDGLWGNRNADEQLTANDDYST